MIFQIKNLIVRPVEKWKRTGILRKNAILHYPRSMVGRFFSPKTTIQLPTRPNPHELTLFTKTEPPTIPGFTNPPQSEKNCHLLFSALFGFAPFTARRWFQPDNEIPWTTRQSPPPHREK